MASRTRRARICTLACGLVAVLLAAAWGVPAIRARYFPPDPYPGTAAAWVRVNQMQPKDGIQISSIVRSAQLPAKLQQVQLPEDASVLESSSKAADDASNDER